MTSFTCGGLVVAVGWGIGTGICQNLRKNRAHLVGTCVSVQKHGTQDRETIKKPHAVR